MLRHVFAEHGEKETEKQNSVFWLLLFLLTPLSHELLALNAIKQEKTLTKNTFTFLKPQIITLLVYSVS